MGGPSDREQQRRQGDRERTERNATWGRCSSHDNQLVDVKGYCPICGEVVGERMVTVQEFETLNPGIRETDADGREVHVDERTNAPGIRETAADESDWPEDGDWLQLAPRAAPIEPQPQAGSEPCMRPGCFGPVLANVTLPAK
jgi:hypothetical protein